MPFLLQRSLTLDNQIKTAEKNKNVKWNLAGKMLSFWSIPENQRQIDEEIKEESEEIRKKQESISFLIS